MKSVFERIDAWESGRNLTPFQRSLDWALYNESGGCFDRHMPGVEDGLFTAGDENRPMSKRSLLSKAVGLSNEKGDSGGFTKFGIAQNAHPDVDVKNMDLPKAEDIYKKSYWDACKCDQMPYHVAFQVFDAACGSGPNKAIKLLQRALGVAEDGNLGPISLASLKSQDQEKFANHFSDIRCQFAHAIAKNNPSQGQFVPGWVRRWRVLKYGEKE